MARAAERPITSAFAYDWSKGGFGGRAVAQQQEGAGGGGDRRPPPRLNGRRFAASEDAAAVETLVAVVSKALAEDPVTLAYALPGKERRYCEAALKAGLLTDSVGRDRRLWLSGCNRAAAVAYLCVGAGAAAAETTAAPPPPLPLWAGAQRAALTAAALTSLKPGEPARACARAATALARVRGAYCAAVERSVGSGGGDGGEGSPRDAAGRPRALVAYVSVLAVEPSAQGRGLGTALLRGVLRELLAKALAGAPPPSAAVAAHAYVEASSERSAALYRRLGFRDVARVEAGGDVLRAAGAGAGAGAGDGGGDDEAAGAAAPPADAPTFIMAAEVKGAFREWLLGGDEDEENE